MKKKPKIITLPNGLELLVVPLANYQTVSAMMLVRAGTMFETKDKNGISHFLEHMCFKGTETMSAKELARAVESMGVAQNAFTWHEFTGYYMKGPAIHAKKMLSLVSDVYEHPVFPAEEMKKEKGVVMGEIDMYEDLPRRKASLELTKLFYGDQPAGWATLGTKKNLRKLKVSDLQQYHGEMYNPRNSMLVVAGNVTVSMVSGWAKKRFAGKPHGKMKTALKPKIDQKEPRLKMVNKPLDQSHITFGFHGIGIEDKDSTAVGVLMSVLGRGFSSRLYERIREDMGAGYYVGARDDQFIRFGNSQIYAGTSPERVEEVFGAMLDEAMKLTKELVSDQELSKTKELLAGHQMMSLETTDSWTEFFGFQKMMYGDIKMPDQIIEEIKKVTAGDIKRLAKKFFKIEKLGLVVVGPKPPKKKLEKVIQSYL
jgi:predicted Zn-dependent peptidase